MNKNYHVDCLYLSPHLNDAVWSCVGLMIRQRSVDRTFAVATIFSKNYLEEDEKDYIERRDEDREVIKALGGKSFHLGIKELPLNSELEIKLPEEDFFSLCLARLFRIFTPKCIFIPLAIGKDKYHKFVRASAERVEDHPKYIYYENRPSSFFHTNQLSFNQAINNMTIVDKVGIESSIFPEVKKAVQGYNSQFYQYYDTVDEWISRGVEYGQVVARQNLYYEQYWAQK